MSVRELVLRICKGNPGAMTVVTKLLVKPDGLKQVQKLESLGLRSSLIWLCYKDMLDCDLDKLYELLKSDGLKDAIKEKRLTDSAFKKTWDYHVRRV